MILVSTKKPTLSKNFMPLVWNDVHIPYSRPCTHYEKSQNFLFFDTYVKKWKNVNILPSLLLLCIANVRLEQHELNDLQLCSILENKALWKKHLWKLIPMFTHIIGYTRFKYCNIILTMPAGLWAYHSKSK